MAKQSLNNLENILTLTIDERAAISDFSKTLRQKFGTMIEEIIMFGSKVSGESEKDSDIDVLIVMNSLSWEIKKAISELAAEENMKHNVLISTVRYDVDTWENPALKASPFGRSVRNKGICL